MLSIILLQDELLSKLMSQQLIQIHPKSPPKPDDERLAVLAIAYHNMGV